MERGMILLILTLFLMPLVSAYLPHQIDTDLNLIVQSNNGTGCNITSIQYPSGSDITTSSIIRLNY